MERSCGNCINWKQDIKEKSDGFCRSHGIRSGNYFIELRLGEWCICPMFSPRTFTCVTCKKNLPTGLNVKKGGGNTCRYCEAKERANITDKLSNVNLFLVLSAKDAICYFCNGKIIDAKFISVNKLRSMPNVPSDKETVKRFCCDGCLPPLLADYPEWFS